MLEEQTLEIHFPGSKKRMQNLRLAQPEFDQMCRDYLSLVAELAGNRSGEVGFDSVYLSDLASSVSDLRAEIETVLEAPTFSRPAQK